MCSNGNPYRLIRTQVLEVTTETPTIKTFRLKPDEEIRFQAGQFIDLTVPGAGEAPFTPSSRASDTAEIAVSVMRVGKVTAQIHALKAGDIVGLRGPYGSAYPLDEFAGREVLVVGGGCGFAPLRSLMYSLFDMSGQFKRLFFRGGCRKPGELLYRDEMKSWGERDDLDLLLTVDEGDETWDGRVGLVTAILDDVPMNFTKGVAIVCGPPIMMKFATQKVLAMGFRPENIFLSMEKNMSCGIGKCGHCRLGVYYCCKDGPVFRYSQIRDFPGIWE
ncbi:MAG TPA: FAD/NAD(P)-binding protein [Candidatus Hydrogenedentes bacterium]|nr:FAD/NAD(P)-binding protein [Candidatus Hydrogenedentota bacterium]HQH54890.1 FAD/NAD(P)-binding protein [Candidatus Hydrogenedentota bacterium]HQM50912.1 FAD/NAD(P)-binding protein [Candidatus Hydrogenedentota bacterium]